LFLLFFVIVVYVQHAGWRLIDALNDRELSIIFLDTLHNVFGRFLDNEVTIIPLQIVGNRRFGVTQHRCAS